MCCLRALPPNLPNQCSKPMIHTNVFSSASDGKSLSAVSDFRPRALMQIIFRETILLSNPIAAGPSNRS